MEQEDNYGDTILQNKSQEICSNICDQGGLRGLVAYDHGK